MAIHERSASTLSLCAVRMEGSARTGFDPCRKSRGHNCCAAQLRQRLPICVATATASVPGLSAVDPFTVLDEQTCRLGFRFPT